MILEGFICAWTVLFGLSILFVTVDRHWDFGMGYLMLSLLGSLVVSVWLRGTPLRARFGPDADIMLWIVCFDICIVLFWVVRWLGKAIARMAGILNSRALAKAATSNDPHTMIGLARRIAHGDRAAGAVMRQSVARWTDTEHGRATGRSALASLEKARGRLRQPTLGQAYDDGYDAWEEVTVDPDAATRETIDRATAVLKAQLSLGGEPVDDPERTK